MNRMAKDTVTTQRDGLDSSIKTWNRLFVAAYVLTILRSEATYGNHIRGKMKEITHDLYKPNPNALYPVLRTLEDEGFIKGEWDNPDTRGKRFYTITNNGIKLIPRLQQRVKARLEYLQELVKVTKENFHLV